MCLSTAGQSSPCRSAASRQMVAKETSTVAGFDLSFISEQPLFKALLAVEALEVHFRTCKRMKRERRPGGREESFPK
jgi:hypothetical protein